MDLVQAKGLAAGRAIKMHVVVVVLLMAAGLLAKGVLYSPAHIVDAVRQSFLLKRVERSVKRYTVIFVAQLLFYV